jgi:putative acetyltransferase
MLISEIRKEHNPVIASIIRKVMGEFDADPQTTILGDPTLDTMYENYQEERSVYFILQDDTKILGGCGIKQLDNSYENICELQRMFLLPEARGKGLGKKLIDLCIQKAKEFQYEKMYLETLSQMKDAISLYEKYNFKRLSKPEGNTGHSGCNLYMTLELIRQ